jgi:hypothetical protein
MSIRMLARELYRLERRVEELAKGLAALGKQPSPDRSRLEAELFQAKKDRDHLRAVLSAKKETPPGVP